MLFCGQCGFKLNAGDKQCPRCGTPVEPGAQIDEEAQSDTPTVASPSLLGNMQAPISTNPDTGGDPQKLILRSNQDAAGNSNYGTQAAYEATRRMEVPEQGYGATPPINPAIDLSHPADFQTHYPQNSDNYPSQGMYPQSGSNYTPYAPQGPAYSNPSQQRYQPYPGQERQTSTNTRGKTAALLMILLGLLFILLAMTLFILERNNVLGNSGGRNYGTVKIAVPLNALKQVNNGNNTNHIF